MAQGFFSIRDHRDMLAKAERELARMEADLDVDTIFNFFVTAYHVMDYVRKVPGLSSASAKAMYDDPDFEMCQFICNKAKHLELNKGDKEARFAPASRTISIVHIASITGPFVSRPPAFFVDGRQIEPAQLGRDLIAKWQAFFTTNGI